MSGEELKHWRMVAFIVRCAQRYSSVYIMDRAEPASTRAAVSDAVAFAAARVKAGGAPDDDLYGGVCMVGHAYFDGYDIEALLSALAAFENAAENTYADLHTDSSIEPSTRRIWAAIRLAGIALHTAVVSHSSADIHDCAHEAASWATDKEPELEAAVGADLIRAITGDTDLSGELEEVFGELWPNGFPAAWEAD